MHFDERRKRLFFTIPAMVGIPLSIVLGLVNMANGSFWLAFFDLLMALLFIGGLAALKYVRNGNLVFRSVVLVAGAIFLYCVYAGGPDGSLIFWLFLMPIIAHFLLGKREGLLWSLITLAVATAILFIIPDSWEAYAYFLPVKIKFLGAYVLVIILTNRYEAARENTQAVLDQEKKKLTSVNATLAHLKKAIEQSMDGIAVAGVDGRIIFVNHAWAHMHGWREEQLHGKPIAVFHTPEQFEQEVKPFNLIVGMRGSHQGEVGHVRQDGTEFPCWMSTSLLKGEDQEPLGLVAVARDITERKKAEESLRASEERSRILLEVTPDPVTVYDPQGNVVYVNPAFERDFGWSNAEVAGRPLDFVPRHEQEKTREALKRLSQGKTTLIETQRFTKEGLLLDVQANAAMFKDRDGNLGGTIVVSRDITQQKRAQKALEEAKQAAEAANLAKSHFVANISHEIRTPMNGVLGMIGLLMETPLTPDQREFAEAANTSAANLLAVINEVLDFSKIEAGRLEMETIDFDLRAIMEEVGDIVGLKAQEKGLEFLCLVEPDVPCLLKGDPGRLRQVLINLSNNAVKFTSEGEVSVRVRLESNSRDEPLWRFSISDTGIGIPEDRQQGLFTPFTQVDASTTREYGGTGLGLSISKRLVEMMGGEIGLFSRPGKGCTFWFTLPFIQRIQQESPPPLSAISQKRVLVVDDNDTNRRILSMLLDSWGMRHEIANGGDLALETLRAAARDGDPFGIVLTDMQMPFMDGEDLGGRIRSDPALQGVILVMMTSIGNRGDASRLEALGFDAYLTKPVKQSVLYNCLQTVLAGDGAFRPDREKSIVTRHAIPAGGPGKHRILLVEDNAINQQVALSILGNMGYTVDTAADGRAALAALGEAPYDLVLMDCQMPVMDGYEATRIIRDPDSPVLRHDIPIIAMTAHAMAGDRKKCLLVGMDDYVTKPVNSKILRQTVERWLAGFGRRARNEDGEDGCIEPPEREQAAIFDRADLFSRMLGDERLVRGVLNVFLGDAPHQLEMLRRALKEGVLAEIRTRAHSLAGACGNISAPAMRQVALEMERAAEKGDLAGAASRMDLLEMRFVNLKVALAQSRLSNLGEDKGD